MSDFRVVLPFNYVNGTTIDANEVNANERETRDKYNSSLHGANGHAHSGIDGDGAKITAAGIDLTANYNWTGLHTFTQKIAASWGGAAAYEWDMRKATGGLTQHHMSRNLTDTGGYLLAAVNDSHFAFLGGVASNGTNYIAKATSASLMECLNGETSFYCNTGLTVGNSYTPTRRFTVAEGGAFLPNAYKMTFGPAGAGSYVDIANTGGAVAQLDFLKGATVLLRIGDTGSLSILSGQQLFFDGGGDTSIRESAANRLMFKTNGVDRWYISSTGRFVNDAATVDTGMDITKGIGNALPAASFEAAFDVNFLARPCAVYVTNYNNDATGYSIGIDFGTYNAANRYLFGVPTDNVDPTGGGGAATGRIKIYADGGLRYIPYY